MDREGGSSAFGVARLVVADDFELFRLGVRTMLSAEPDMEVVGEAKDGGEAVEKCRELRPDLVLMDVEMPVMDGLEATRRIKRELPRTPVLVLTAYPDPDYLFEALKAGAAGYVLKHAGPDEVLAAVRGALSGESPLDSQLSAHLLRRLVDEKEENREDPPRHPVEEREESLSVLEKLTPREEEVLKHLARGRTNPQIARKLSISAGTAKIHVQNILLKLGVSGRTQAAVLAVELGLASTGEG